MKCLSRLKYMLIYLIIFSVFNGECKKICLRQLFKLTDDNFFKRLQVSDAEACAEACVQHLGICRSAMYLKSNDSNVAYCNLYTMNLESRNASDNVTQESKAELNTVFEILDECPQFLLNRSEEMMSKLDRKLYKRLIEFNDTESDYGGSTPLRRYNTDQFTHVLKNSKISYSQKSVTPSTVISESEDMTDFPIPNEDFFESIQDETASIKRDKNSHSQFNIEDLGSVQNDQLNIDKNVIYPASKRRLLSTEDSYTQTTQYLYPIRPSQVFYRNSPYSCSGTDITYLFINRPNCYAPAVRQVPQAVHYGNPCDISPVTGPCYAKLSYPCTAQLIPCSVAQQMPVAVAPLSAAVGAPATSHSEDEQYDGLWSEWSSLTACSVTCGVGVVQRRRVCSIEGHCFGEAFREEACERGPCPASASPDRWSTWSEWTSCSRSCGVGKQERERVCETGRNCLGSPKDIRECNVNECERWSEWGEWSLCTPSCGPGSQKRYRQKSFCRECVSETSCSGSPSEQRACDSGPCGAWTEWHSWTDCSRSCGSGVKTRSRTCIGQNCVGDDVERLTCNEHDCPVWSLWSPWSQCSVSCGERGTRTRSRQCLYKDPGQSLCDGPYEDESNCPSLQPCEEWSEWREWSPCTVSCGHGNQVRVRVCLPPHLHCKGNNRETRGCNEGMCPYWNNWSEWSECSVTCGAGTKTRTRICVKDDIPSLPNIDELIAHSNRDVRMKNAAKAVLIESSRNRLKNGSAAARHNIFRNLKMKDYPLENYMINHFGLKSIERKRNVDAGSGCYGSDFDRQLCYREPCCELTQWSQWTECSATCGGGRRTRRRHCRPQNGFLPSESSSASQETPVTQRSRSKPIYMRGTVSRNMKTNPDSIFAGLQPIVPVKQFARPKRQSSSHYSWHSIVPSDAENASEQNCHCDGKTVEEMKCNTQPCLRRAQRYRCGWSQWSEWCGCSEACDTGIRIRNRYCDDEAALQNLGIQRPYYPNADCRCFGDSIQSVPCATGIMKQECLPRAQTYLYDIRPVNALVNTARKVTADCAWSPWNDWSSCVQNRVSRTRSCVAISAARQVRCNCEGANVETKSCNLSEAYSTDQKVFAPSDGNILQRSSNVTSADSCNWESWSQWSECSVTCGNGERIRRRHCPCRSCGDGSRTEVAGCELEDCDESKRRKNPFER